MKEIKRNDIYYAELNPVVGSEQGGLRPVLILQNDTGNKYSPTTIVAAITSRQSKSRLPTHVNITADGLAKDSVVLLEQIRTIDKSRLTEYVGRLDKQTMETFFMAFCGFMLVSWRFMWYRLFREIQRNTRCKGGIA